MKEVVIKMNSIDRFNDKISRNEYDKSKYLYAEYNNISIAITKKNFDAKNKSDLKQVCDELGFSSENITFNNQIHSSIVRKIDEQNVSLTVDADSLVTNIKNIPLVVFTADCVPIVLIDTKNKAVGIAHAGWRGTYGNIVVKTIDKMIEHYGTQISNLDILIGPCISGKSYNVSYDLIDKFSVMLSENGIDLNSKESFYCCKDDVYYLDLSIVNKLLLMNIGVKQDRIFESGICTFIDDEFFSYRKDSKTSKRIGTIVEIR